MKCKASFKNPGLPMLFLLLILTALLSGCVKQGIGPEEATRVALNDSRVQNMINSSSFEVHTPSRETVKEGEKPPEIILPVPPSDPAVAMSEIHPDESAGRLTHTIVMNTSQPPPVDSIMVYKVVQPHYTRQDIISLGEKFNMSPNDRIKQGDVGFGIMKTDHSRHVYLKNTGSVEFVDTTRAHNPNPLDVPGNLPSDEEAIAIATKFLKDRDLLPEGAVSNGVTHGKIYRLMDGGPDIVTWEDIEVWFDRKLNGYPVEGTQLELAIGGRGDVLEYFTNWRTYEPYKKFAVKAPEQALEELKTSGVPTGMNTPDNFTVNKMYLGYHTKAGAYTENYLEPVWVFKGNVIVNGSPAMYMEQYIPALKEVPPEFINS